MSLSAPSSLNSGAQSLRASTASEVSSGQSREGRAGDFSRHLDAQKQEAQRRDNPGKVQNQDQSRSENKGLDQPESSEKRAAVAENAGAKARAQKAGNGKSEQNNSEGESADRATAGKAQAEESRANQAPGQQTDEDRAAQSQRGDAFENVGLEQAPALGLPELEVETPKAVGERVLSLLAEGGSLPREDSQSGGNLLPLESSALPLQVATLGVESGGESADLVLAQGDEALSTQQNALASATERALSDEALVSTHLVATQSAAVARQSQMLSAGAAQGASVTPGVGTVLAQSGLVKQPLEQANTIDSDAELEPELALGASHGNEAKVGPLGISGGAAKMTPVGAETATDIVPKTLSLQENIELVRKNLMAAMIGKSDLTNAGTLIAGRAGGEINESLLQAAPSQPLNLNNLVAPLLNAAGDAGKFAAPGETTFSRVPFFLQTAAGESGWDLEVGNRIRWMVEQKNPSVELRLNPRELGSIDVKVTTEGERTSVSFISSHAAARDVLESALPRLREMFAGSGIELANADVSGHGFQRQEREQLVSRGGFAGDDDLDGAMIESELLTTQPGERGRGVVDYYV